MKKYESLEIEIVKFDVEDIITASGGDNVEPGEGGIY